MNSPMKNNNQNLTKCNLNYEEFSKTTRKISDQTFSGIQPAETAKIIEKFQKIAQQQKQKRSQVQNDYKEFKQRCVHRENQFYRIIQSNQKHFSDNKEDQYHNYIEQIYNKILCTFQAFNEKARSLLDDRYSELYRLMERRIDMLMQKMENQLAKYRKISHTERKQIQEAIKDIAAIAAETQKENNIFRKTNQSMQLKIKLLNEEKVLLLSEVNNLKAHLNKKNRRKLLNNSKLGSSSIGSDEIGQFAMQFQKNFKKIQTKSLLENKQHHKRTLTNRYGQKSTKNSQSPLKTLHQTVDLQKIEHHRVDFEGVIIHLKQQLVREKNRNMQLMRFNLQLQAKLNKIQQLINEEVIKFSKKTSESLFALASVEKERKLFKENQSNTLIDSKQQNLQVFKEKIEEKLAKDATFKENFFQQFFAQLKQILLFPQKQILILKGITKQHEAINRTNNHDHISVKQNFDSLKEYQNQIEPINQKSEIDFSSYPQQSSKPDSQVSNRSRPKRYNYQSRKKEINPLFLGHYPLDLMEIAKSIELK